MSSAIESFDFSEYDLVFSSSNAFAKGVITNPDTTHICYCHSPMRYSWDWYFEYLKENKLGWLARKIVKLVIHKIRLWDRASAERVDYWIANSQNVRSRIKKYYHKDSEIIHCGTNIDKYHISESPKDYFLVVSRLSAYKKTDLVVKAFNKLGLPLVVVGTGEQYNILKSIAKSNVQIVGYKSDKEVVKYLSECRAFIHPQEEDFGLTQVEAMASGRPVIAYKKGGSLEVVKAGENGIFFEEPTSESLIKAIQKFEKIEKEFDPKKIRQSVEKFDNKKFKATIEKFVEEKVKQTNCPLPEQVS
jgi:glycosyltransferase involved in cell wall biosynthesis